MNLKITAINSMHICLCLHLPIFCLIHLYFFCFLIFLLLIYLFVKDQPIFIKAFCPIFGLCLLLSNFYSWEKLAMNISIFNFLKANSSFEYFAMMNLFEFITISFHLKYCCYYLLKYSILKFCPHFNCLFTATLI